MDINLLKYLKFSKENKQDQQKSVRSY